MSATCLQRAFSPGRDEPAMRHFKGLLRRAWSAVHRTTCALQGHRHQMMLHFEPDRLSLRCPACGAETAGWRITIDPRFRSLRKPVVHRAPKPHRSAA